MCHMSYATCHVTHVTCHLLHVVCHYFPNIKGGRLYLTVYPELSPTTERIQFLGIVSSARVKLSVFLLSFPGIGV